MALPVCILLGGALAAALWGLWLLKKDIRQLGHTLGAISQVHTHTSLTTNTFDADITALAASINAMLECHQQDLLEKVHAEAALKSAITNISHDLRTPLTSALGYLQMLEGTVTESSGLSEMSQETQARYLSTIRERLETLAAQMNNLFEFARLIEGHTPLDIQEVNICNVLRNTLSASYSELISRGFIVDISIPDTPIICFVDEDALGRILQNLIKNAYMHGKETMSVRFAGSAIEIANKTDTLSSIDLDHLFERFYTPETSRSSKNTGLGLAIARELTEQMDGRISARKAENDMLVMRITFPT